MTRYWVFYGIVLLIGVVLVAVGVAIYRSLRNRQ